MDSSTYKRYHVHGFNSRQYLEDYFSDKPDMAFGEDGLKFPIEHFTKIFTSGHIKGDVLIDLSLGPIVHHLYAPSEVFKHIIVLKVSDRCIMELRRWLDTRTGAFDWGHATKLHGQIQGNSDQFREKEEKVRSVIPHVMKCDLGNENMTDPIVLPPADCLICAGILDTISKDQDEYIRYLKKFSGLLKPGGHLILFGGLGTTYYTIGKETFHALTYDEDFVRKALVGEGFVIDFFKAKKRTAVSDLIDYQDLIFLAAHKETLV